MVRRDEISDRFIKPRAGQPPYYLDDISIVFLDLVRFSKEKEIKKMSSVVRDLQDCIHNVLNEHYYWDETRPEKPNRIILLPTGDGYLIAFHPVVDRKIILGHIEALTKALVHECEMTLRIGVGRGPHFLFIDLNNILNLIGTGAIHAQRAMLLCNPNQILCTGDFVAGLIDQVPDIREIPGKWQVKDERPMELFSYYSKTKKFGRMTDLDPKYEFVD